MTDLLLMTPFAPPELTAELERRFATHHFWEMGEAGAIPPAVAARISAIATTGSIGASAALMAALPKLKMIAVNGVGFDAIDLEVARARGIAITTTPDVLTDAVADMAVSLALAASRRIVEGDRFVREGKWLAGRLGLGWSLRGQTAGILGYGRIGRRIAEILEAFEMTVLYCDLAPAPGREAAFRPTAEALARDCRVLIVAAAGGAGTRELVDCAVLRALGPSGLLVNVARGSVVKEPDLIAALEAGELGAAALDVFADEPKVPPALTARDNVIATPHIASATLEARLAMGRLVIDNLAAFFEGRPLVTPLALAGP